MLQTGLSVYRFSLKEVRREIFLNLQQHFGTDDFLDLIDHRFEEFCIEQRAQEESDEAAADQTRKKVLEFDKTLGCEVVQKDNRDFYKYIAFRVRYGEAGVRSDIENTLTGEVDFVQEPHHAAMRPFHVFLGMPTDADAKFGLLIMQRIQREGLKSVLPVLLNLFYRKQDPACIFRANPVASEEHVMKILDSGAVESIRLTKYYSHDRAGAGSLYSSEEQRIFKRPALDNVKRIARNCIRAGTINGTGLVAIDSFMPDCVDLFVDIRGKKKKVSLTNIDTVDFTQYYSMEDGIQFDDGNLPISETLLPVMHSIMEDYIEVLWR